MQIVIDNWQQMSLLSESAKEDVRLEKVENLASELTREDPPTVNEMIQSHRLNDKEIELLLELLHINYILEVQSEHN